MHTPLVQTPKSDIFNPTVRTKFSMKPTSPTSVYVYKSEGLASKGTRVDIIKFCHVRPLVRLSSVNLGRTFAVSLTVESVMVWKSEDSSQGISAHGDFMLVKE